MLFGDLGAKNITKVHAIDVLLAHLGAERADTIAFGDANVDIPMMEYCAYGVALGSSGAKIRSKADLVTDGVGQKSLWNVFCKLGLVDKN